MQDNAVPRETVASLVDGTITWKRAKELVRLPVKDADRFWKYLDVLQSRVFWKEKILLRVSEHLYIVAKGRERLVKCDCGHEFGDYRVNWKLGSRVRVRRTREDMKKVFPVEVAMPDVERAELREYYCPGCLSLLSVETAPVGQLPVFEVLPDLDTFYRDWLGKPLPDESPDWFQDRTCELTGQWARED